MANDKWQDADVAGADFTKVRFGNAAFDGALFERCDFRGADFSPTTRLPRPTTGARFEDCDLRDTRWGGRDLTATLFVRCKFAGIIGFPASLDSIEIVAPDLSADGDGSKIGNADDVIALFEEDPVERYEYELEVKRERSLKIKPLKFD